MLTIFLKKNFITNINNKKDNNKELNIKPSLNKLFTKHKKLLTRPLPDLKILFNPKSSDIAMFITLTNKFNNLRLLCNNLKLLNQLFNQYKLLSNQQLKLSNQLLLFNQQPPMSNQLKLLFNQLQLLNQHLFSQQLRLFNNQQLQLSNNYQFNNL